MAKRKILIQLDPDPHPSVFDRVVAVDSGVEELFSYGGVKPEDVEALAHGAMFTRGPGDLASTAFFIGGKQVSHAEELLARLRATFMGPFRCSVLLDANGCNTTAAAAVLAARHHADLAHSKALVLGGTGPVGQRIALLLALQHSAVWIGSRSLDRATDVANRLLERVPGSRIFPVSISDPESISQHPEKFEMAFAAGSVGVRLIHREHLRNHTHLKVLIDLNAVSPSGIEGVEPTDHGRQVDSVVQYGALGVGKMKMRIHKAAIARLFEANDLVLDAPEVFQIGLGLDSP